MASLVIPTLCLVAVCSLPGGDSTNLGLQRIPLDGSRSWAANSARVARSLLVARLNQRGIPVNALFTGNRRVFNAPVTSHGRLTSQRRFVSTVTKPRQSLVGSRGFATFNGQQFVIKPHQGLVPFNSGQANQKQHSNGVPANQRSRKTASTNRRIRPAFSSNQIVPFLGSFTSSQSVRPTAGNIFRTRVKSRPTKRRFNTSQQNSRPHVVRTHSPQRNKNNKNNNNNNNNNLLPNSNVLQSAFSNDIPTSVYKQGLEAHNPLNARGMLTFLIKRSQRPRQYLDRTKGTSTLHTSRPGQCPVVDQSRCAPLPKGPLPPSCSNDYQCTGQQSKCCYDPCLASSKCAKPVDG